MLYQLSYASLLDQLERETGIEPATNSLEGCDSTIELLPPWKETRSARTDIFILRKGWRAGQFFVGRTIVFCRLPFSKAD